MKRKPMGEAARTAVEVSGAEALEVMHGVRPKAERPARKSGGAKPAEEPQKEEPAARDMSPTITTYKLPRWLWLAVRNEARAIGDSEGKRPDTSKVLTEILTERYSKQS